MQLLTPLDVEFDRTPTVSLDTAGLPYIRWVRTGMPRLGKYQSLLDAVFFLYPTVEAAKKGEAAGGTGFFVGLPSTQGERHCFYAVTNWHVALGTKLGPPCPVIRVNTKNGSSIIWDHDPSEWSFIGGKQDVAVLPVNFYDPLKVTAIDGESFFLNAEDIQKHQINAGDDCFMLGRFIDYDGIEVNAPSMRFGNISMMSAVVKQPTGYMGSSYVVDMHSRTGFSGSPVFVYQTSGSIFHEGQNIILGGGHLLRLLGILWGQFPEEWDITDKAQSANSTVPILTGKSIKGMSGMSLVIPTSSIVEVLNLPDLKKMRDVSDAKALKNSQSGPVRQSANRSTDENPTHREDFMRLATEAARKQKQGE